MLLIQIILVFFFVLAIGAVWSKFRRADLRLGMVIFWTIFWILAGVVVVVPDSTMSLARILGVGRGVDAIIYLALAMLFYLFFKNTVQLEKMNRDLTKVTRALALRDAEKEHK